MKKAILIHLIILPFFSGAQSSIFNANAIKTKGWFNITEISYGEGFGNISDGGSITHGRKNIENPLYSLGINTINGYQFEKLMVGVGLGYNNYPSHIGKYDADYITVSLDARYSILKSRLTPVIGMNIGYDIGFGEIHNAGATPVSSGLIISPSVGSKYFITTKTAITLNVGLKFRNQTVSRYYYNAGVDPVTHDFYFSNYAINATEVFKYLFVSAGVCF